MNNRSILDHLLPPRCLLCGGATQGRLLCKSCDTDLPWLGQDRCPQCAQPSPQAQLCGPCLRDAPAFDRTHAALIYDFPIASVIQALKYGQRLEIGPALAEIWLDAARPSPMPDLLVPMPLHPARLRERGFNQAVELARRLAPQCRVPLDRDACRRIRDTPPQAALPLKARRKNLRNAFAARPDRVGGKRIAIVDDVMTSGSSLNELAIALKKAGAIEVECWVMARALQPG